MERTAKGKDGIAVYCDASFSKHYQIAVAGFMIVENDVSVLEKEDSAPIQWRVFFERNNIRAELLGAIVALETLIAQYEHFENGSINIDRRINLTTDCQTIVRLKGRREKLEVSGFVSGKTGRKVNNADLYKRFFTLCDKIDLQVRWVKGHSQSANRDPIQREFSRLDKTVRKKLRDVCKNLAEENGALPSALSTLS